MSSGSTRFRRWMRRAIAAAIVGTVLLLIAVPIMQWPMHDDEYLKAVGKRLDGITKGTPQDEAWAFIEAGFRGEEYKEFRPNVPLVDLGGVSLPAAMNISPVGFRLVRQFHATRYGSLGIGWVTNRADVYILIDDAGLVAHVWIMNHVPPPAYARPQPWWQFFR